MVSKDCSSYPILTAKLVAKSPTRSVCSVFSSTCLNKSEIIPHTDESVKGVLEKLQARADTPVNDPAPEGRGGETG